MFSWPGSQPFAMWGYREGPEEATPEAYRTECAIRMMRRFAKGAQPWHLEVHYVEPHDPYMPLKNYLDRYDPRAIPVARSFSGPLREQARPAPPRVRNLGASHARTTSAQSRAHYYAYTEQLDAQIGRLLKALDETGQADNTLVVFTTDHGDTVGAHRMWIKGWIPYEECYRDPDDHSLAGANPARNERAITWSSCRTWRTHTPRPPAPKPMPYPDGRSLVPLFENPQRPDWSDDILCAYYGGEFLYTQRIAINRRYKYVFNGFDFDELYDLEADPDEMRNVVGDPQLPRASRTTCAPGCTS